MSVAYLDDVKMYRDGENAAGRYGIRNDLKVTVTEHRTPTL